MKPFDAAESFRSGESSPETNSSRLPGGEPVTKPRRSLYWLLGMAAMWFGAGLESVRGASLSDTRSALEKWVETRQTLARTRADWKEEKDTLQNTLQLFQRELESLDARMSAARTNVTQARKEMTELDYEKALLGAALDKARELAGRFEREIRDLTARLPVPLADKIDPLLKKIPDEPEETKRSVLERMQNIVGIVNEIDKFNGSVTVESEVRKNPAGADVQVRTLYLGLGQAYFVDKSGDYAGLGVPSAEGWEWTSRPELGPTIQNAIAVYENTQPAAFVGLPVQIK